ncbi:MAG: hypothetical protein M3120_01625 [Pseudomonadota bacterium]|nr:hypothetical protein [Pseudomonadota bacterium]
MNAADIIALAGAHGVSLTADTKRIIARPGRKLTPQLREAIRNHSIELLEVLTRDNRCARFDSDTKPPGHVSDDPRQQDRVPRDMRQDDRRTAPSNPGTQGSTTKKLEAIEPAGPCPDCGSGQWWQLPGEPWHCRACEPDMPLTATTLTLPCHKEQAQPVAAHAGADHMIETVCEDLNITPEHLFQELEAHGDLPDLISGALTPKALRLTTKTLALMRYRPENERCLR